MRSGYSLTASEQLFSMRPCGSRRLSRQPDNASRAWCFRPNRIQSIFVAALTFSPPLAGSPHALPLHQINLDAAYVRLIAKSAHSHPAEQDTASSQRCVLIRLERINHLSRCMHTCSAPTSLRSHSTRPVSKESSDLLEWQRNMRVRRPSTLV
jgi:hypothetical protein